MNNTEVLHQNLPALLKSSAEKFKDKLALTIPGGPEYTYSEIDDLSSVIAAKLYGAGVKKGDKISIIGENSPQWVISYFGIQRCGAVVIPILTDFRGNEMFTILEHAEASIVCISRKQMEKFENGLPSSVKFIITLEDLQMHDIKEFEKIQKSELKDLEKIVVPEKIEAFAYPEADKDDLAVIIYTSGTTGRSKGVMLTHDNLIFDAVKTGTIHQVVSSDVFISVLPLAHTYESTIGMIIPMMSGASIHYIDKAPTASYLGPILQKIRPTTMLTVPLIMEKIYKSRIKPGIQDSVVTRTLVKFGPTRKLIHKAAGKKLMAYFGGRMRFFGIGGAPLAPEVEKFLIEAQFPYAIGYGLTETSPMLAGFNPSSAVYKSVGKVMEGVEIIIHKPDPTTGEGEILAKGRNVMKGYYKNEEETKKVFNKEGYFKTGDLGLLDKNGILYIKGRSKNMILGANGENIYPEEIESLINEQDYVAESLVLQIKGKLVAKVHLNMDQLEEKFKNALSSAQDKQSELNKKIDEILNDLQQHVNMQISKNSKIHQVLLQAVPFEKTPTLKIKRFLYKD